MTAPEARRPAVILGASGYIGQVFARLLADHPSFSPALLVGGESTVGRALSEVWRLPDPVPPELGRMRLVRASADRIRKSGVTVAFSALPTGTAGAIESGLALRGISVFSNAADLRQASGGLLVIPEVNGDRLARSDPRAPGPRTVVTNPNCSATGLALALAPIRDLLRPTAVHVATYQSLSGAGWPGVPALAVADNLLPYIPEEEEKIARETATLLGSPRGRAVRNWPTPIHANCARVGTREGHLEAVTLHARARPALRRILDAWTSFRPLRSLGLPSAPDHPIVVRSERDRPQPLLDRWAGTPARAHGMAVSIGRVRWEPPTLRFFLLVNNSVRGGAGGSVLNAEYALAHGGLPSAGPG